MLIWENIIKYGERINFEIEDWYRLKKKRERA